MPHETDDPLVDAVSPQSQWVNRAVREIQVVLGCERHASFEEFVAIVDAAMVPLPAPPTAADRIIVSVLLQKIIMRFVRERPNCAAVLHSLQKHLTFGSVLDAQGFRTYLSLLRPANVSDFCKTLTLLFGVQQRHPAPWARRGRLVMDFVYAIDRFDGQDWVVLEDDGARTFNVPRSWVPPAAREGSVIRVLVEPQSDTTALRLELDAEATAARIRDAEHRRRNLPRGPKGDLSL